MYLPYVLCFMNKCALFYDHHVLNVCPLLNVMNNLRMYVLNVCVQWLKWKTQIN
jgi:hypothetical protein